MFYAVLGRYDEAKQMFEKAAQLSVRGTTYYQTGSDLCAERQTTRGARDSESSEARSV
jgi:hypothetical protein